MPALLNYTECFSVSAVFCCSPKINMCKEDIRFYTLLMPESALRQRKKGKLSLNSEDLGQEVSAVSHVPSTSSAGKSSGNTTITKLSIQNVPINFPSCL